MATKSSLVIMRSIVSDLDGLGVPDRQPADAVAHRGRRAGEDGLDRVALLAEVLPALVVDRDRGVRAQLAEQLDRLGRGHRVAQRARDWELHAAEVHERGADVDPRRDLA